MTIGNIHSPLLRRLVLIAYLPTWFALVMVLSIILAMAEGALVVRDEWRKDVKAIRECW